MKSRRTILKTVSTTSIALLAVLFVSGCGGTSEAGSRVGNPPTVSTTNAFPENFAVTSPLDSGESLEAGAELTRALTAQADQGRPAYHAAVERISNILEGDAPTACTFRPGRILARSANAECYGPDIPYDNHPDALPEQSADGALPTGDLGIWTEYDDPTDNACAAAQLNARMRGIQFRSQTALEALASLLCIVRVNNLELPENGATLDLKSALAEISAENNMGLTFASEDAVSITVTSNDDNSVTYSYVLEFSFTEENVEHAVKITMTHVDLQEDGAYKGKYSYAVDANDDFQMNCPAEEITEAGSVLYSMQDSDVAILADEASYCGHGVDPVQADGLIDPSDKYDPAINADGWGLNFSTATANFDRETLTGNYSYVWQAGPQDDYSRAFNVRLDADVAGLLSGTAFFGFGDEIAATDGGINTFLCNYAGPGAFRTPRDYVQRQGLIQTEAGGRFDSVADLLQIRYAPVDSCNYSGAGDFSYDLDPNMETVLMSDPAEAVLNDLLPLTETTFEDAGFFLPEAPANDF